MSSKNKAIDAIRQFSYSPRKTRQHVQVNYDKDKKQCNKSDKISKSNIKQISNIKKDNNDCVSNLKEEKKNKRNIEESQNSINIVNLVNCTEGKNMKWQPGNWELIYKNLKEMRSVSNAPVDSMGCDKCFDETTDAKTKRFQILVSLILSSQTKDQVTFEAMKRLKNKNLTPEGIVEMDVSTLEQLLNPVSFYKNKSKYLKKTSEILVEKYDSDIPKTVDELIKLPGVGPKMAHICMNSAWNQVTGIGVDVHVHRISNRLGWVSKTTKTPEDTRKELESWLPFEKWKEINHLMVGFGQTICTPQRPKCNECLNKDICPYGLSNFKKQN